MKSKWNTPLVQNVEFESLFCVPNAACCHYTTFWIWCRRWDSNPRSMFQAELFKSSMYVTPSLRHIQKLYFCTASLVNVNFLLWCLYLIFCMVNHNTYTIYVWRFLTLHIFFQHLEKTLKLCLPSIVLYRENQCVCCKDFLLNNFYKDILLHANSFLFRILNNI